MKRLIMSLALIVILITVGCRSLNSDVSNNKVGVESSADSESNQSANAIKADDFDEREQLKAEDESAPTYTREDYNEMRKSLHYEPFEIDYDAEYVQNGYLEIDKTAGILEEYIGSALMGLTKPREIPNVLQDNNLIFQAAGFCTRGFDINENPLIENVGAWYSATPIEHLDLTAQYLYGDECVIDYENLEANGYYGYAEEFGLALRYNLAKEGLVPTVLDYKDMDDYFQVTVVFLAWHNMLEIDELCYRDEAADIGDSEIRLNKETAKDFCFSNKPDKYSVRINKGEDGKLYMRSVLLIPKESVYCFRDRGM